MTDIQTKTDNINFTDLMLYFSFHLNKISEKLKVSISKYLKVTKYTEKQ